VIIQMSLGSLIERMSVAITLIPVATRSRLGMSLFKRERLMIVDRINSLSLEGDGYCWSIKMDRNVKTTSIEPHFSLSCATEI
jgi:hypothetical protein